MTSPTPLADRIFFSGPIVTVDDDQPSAEALAVKGA
jgi:predicted amidohydrolase YtcJ